MKTRTKIPFFFSFLLMILLPLACTETSDSSSETRSFEKTHQDTSAANSVTVSLNPTHGNNVTGSVLFTPVSQGGLHAKGRIIGLSRGDHGFHIHEKGDCSAPDASSAGEHFNPTGTSHGGPDDSSHHVGDMGNVTAGEDGVVQIDRVFEFLSLQGAHSILGRSLVVHAGRDDLTSNPAGNSGARVACGVIKLR